MQTNRPTYKGKYIPVKKETIFDRVIPKDRSMMAAAMVLSSSVIENPLNPLKWVQAIPRAVLEGVKVRVHTNDYTDYFRNEDGWMRCSGDNLHLDRYMIQMASVGKHTFFCRDSKPLGDPGSFKLNWFGDPVAPYFPERYKVHQLSDDLAVVIEEDYEIVIYYYAESEEAYRRDLCKRYWEIAPKMVNISFVNRKGYRGGYDISAKTIELNPRIKTTKVVKRIAEVAKRYADLGHCYSLLLYGDSGSGKTIAAQQLCSELGYKSVFTNAGDIRRADLKKVLHQMRPEALVIDDFERSDDPEKYLSIIEDATRICKIIVVTVNCLERLPGALIRPGRFDHIEEFQLVDKEANVRSLLGDDIVDHMGTENFKRLCALPLAYVDAYRKHAEVCGPDAAIQGLSELEKRLEYIRRRDDITTGDRHLKSND